MRWTHKNRLSGIILASLLLFCCFCSSVSADEITVNFQSLGLIQQDVKLFDSDGDLVTVANTSSSVTLNSSESAFYTIQIQPSPVNQDPVHLLDSVVGFLTNNALIVALVLFAVLVIAGRRR